MKTSEQILVEIGSAMELNKNIRAKCNMALSDAISLIQHNEKEMQNRLDEEFDNIFDKNLSARYVITNSNPFRVKEKISAYHKAQEDESNKIHVGDVVQHIADATKATILDNDLNTNLDMKKWMVFTENGCVESWYEDDFSKTGESVDVCSALIK